MRRVLEVMRKQREESPWSSNKRRCERRKRKRREILRRRYVSPGERPAEAAKEWTVDRKDNERKARKEWRTKNQEDDNCHIFLVSGNIKMRLIFLIGFFFLLFCWCE